MKYMIIKGAKSSGKSVTVKEICKRLKPQAIKKVCFDEQGNPLIEPAIEEELDGSNYIATVKDKRVLMVAISPTEQKKRVTDILHAVKQLEIMPDFAIVSMCGLEKLKNFATAKELENFGHCVHETKIWRIPAHEYNSTDEWNKRVTHLTSIAAHYL